MRAHEQQLQPLVGKGRLHPRHVFRFAREPEQRLVVPLHLGVARRIDQPIARGVQQPRLGLLRHAIDRPALHGRRERLAERVFGGRDVARPRRQVGDEPAVRLTNDPFDRGLRRGISHCAGYFAFDAKYDPPSGITSMLPVAADGLRAAHSSAASRSGTSMIVKPPRNSLLSA
jgi:hypothetical protein